MKQPRWKTYQFWTALSAAVVLIAERLFALFGTSFFATQELGEVVMAICSLLVVLGIVVKPKQSQTTIENGIELSEENEKENTSCLPKD